MDSSNLIAIKDGRHLLYEMATDNYIPNDTLLVGRGDDEPMADQADQPLVSPKVVVWIDD